MEPLLALKIFAPKRTLWATLPAHLQSYAVWCLDMKAEL